MLYKKNSLPELSDELFKNPTSEYRGTPFWAWNCELSPELLKKEIEYLKEMGFGGYHIHPRVGMSTEYLSDDFMALIRTCIEKGKSEDMLTYLYDEDKWPSGFAGGYNTKDVENRQKYVYFTSKPYKDDTLTLKEDIDAARDDGAPETYRLIACYDIILNDDEYMTSYKRIGVGDKATGTKWFAYLEYADPGPWYNDQAYCDTLKKDVIESFIKITHERYKECIGEEFDKTVPSIFTDEPQVKCTRILQTPTKNNGGIIAFTTDFDDTFKKTYGYSIIDRMPEIFFEKVDTPVSLARYHYRDHVSERFAAAFADTIGEWCGKNGISMTGHMMQEPRLWSQTTAIGESMRSYRGFQLPGIDMLCDERELTTAKQCQSAVHQYGREGMLSELYGVTNWDFDFKGHKLQGDWQAALGVTVRVPHLFWVSMRGEAKRDYPASIGYQSPWFREYKYIEDHFARVNTAMTRGTPLVDIAVIHPIESYWVRLGPESQTGIETNDMQKRFEECINWLLYGTLDFDYICESLLPSQFGGTDGGLCVGQMKYKAVVVLSLLTIRSTTLDALEKFEKSGGKIIFMGEIPEYVDAEKSQRAKKLAAKCTQIHWSRNELLKALDTERFVEIRSESGNYSSNLIYQLRQDGEKKHIFVSHVNKPSNYDIESPDTYRIKLKGEWKVTKLDTLSGEKYAIPAEYANGKTLITWQCCTCDSLLLELAPGKSESGNAASMLYKRYTKETWLMDAVPYTLSEPNVLVLDIPRYSINGGEVRGPQEILRADNEIRDYFGLRHRDGSMVQPWVSRPDKNPKETVTLYYDFDSEIEYDGAELGLESVMYASVKLNGTDADMSVIGYYVDEDSIKKIRLPKIHKGKNTLEVTYRFGAITQLEAMYVLGKFGVEQYGTYAKIIPLPEKLCFGDITRQGLPFYGGNVTYHLSVCTSGDFGISVPKFRGNAVTVDIDGKRAGMIAFTPHVLDVKDLGDGEHRIDLTLLGNRANTFGAMHCADEVGTWWGPYAWRRNGNYFGYEYRLKRTGILTCPKILK
ncbi:MAG: hypothetical protein KBS59_02820 [Clostridiales bacterium]|nr:hypothetical protein [Clostridiales bacterium]